jgi:glycine dehydrogenase subunit 1
VRGVRTAFNTPCFHEAVIVLDRPVAPVLKALEARGILGGFNLAEHYPELGNALLVCATETKTDEDIESYTTALAETLKDAKAA